MGIENQESERVNDIDKAETMARLTKSAHDRAAKAREELRLRETGQVERSEAEVALNAEVEEELRAETEEELRAEVKYFDNVAKETEEAVASDYDIRKSTESMKDEELESALKKVYEDLRIASKRWRALKETAQRARVVLEPRAVQKIVQAFASEFVEKGLTDPLEIAAALEEKVEEAEAAFNKIQDRRLSMEGALVERWARKRQL